MDPMGKEMYYKCQDHSVVFSTRCPNEPHGSFHTSGFIGGGFSKIEKFSHVRWTAIFHILWCFFLYQTLPIVKIFNKISSLKSDAVMTFCVICWSPILVGHLSNQPFRKVQVNSPQHRHSWVARVQICMDVYTGSTQNDQNARNATHDNKFCKGIPFQKNISFATTASCVFVFFLQLYIFVDSWFSWIFLGLGSYWQSHFHGGLQNPHTPFFGFVEAESWWNFVEAALRDFNYLPEN